MNQKKTKNGFAGLYAVFLVAAIILAFVAFGAGYWLSNREVAISNGDDQLVDETNQDDSTEASEPEIVSPQGVLQINWYTEPEEVEPLDVVKALEPDGANDDVKTYVLGTIASGEYNGMMLTVNIVPYIGMGETNRSFYLITSENESQKPVLLDRYAIDGASFFQAWSGFYSFIERNYSEDMRHEYPEDTADYDALFSAISVDTESVISEFEHEDMAVDQSGNEYRVLGLSDLAVYPNKLKLSEFTLSTQIDGDNLYSITGDEESLEGSLSGLKNLFFTLDQGGRVVVYDAFIPFWDYKDNSYISDLTIFADSTITGSYSKALSGGCGLASITNVVSADETGPLSQLGYVKDASGNKYDIYEPENYSMEYYLDDYNMWFNWHKEGQLGDFLAIHPILYYQDSLGRWIEFKHVDALSQAECGKPVIYLYPEVETQIDVTLSPQGGFTYTEPVYNDGWSVTASPDGTLINLADGQTYPYLFWEGRGGLYASPSNYWVVEKSQVEDFLTSTLHKYGLNDQETADFMEFWLPRMQASAYYKIGFHGTQAMNILAPMTLSVHPDSVLRILMDYQELEAPIEQDPPVIVPFDREGFAVVEWGGVIW